MSLGKKRRAERGFTLIELLVVIAIIGILASVILVSLGTARAKARDARRISDMSQLKNALELYFGSYNRYPRSQEFKAGNDDKNTKTFYLVPKFLPNMPADPLYTDTAGNPQEYTYVGLQDKSLSSTGCFKYHLLVTLEQGVENTPLAQSKAGALGGKICAGETFPSDIDGNDPMIYDIVP